MGEKNKSKKEEREIVRLMSKIVQVGDIVEVRSEKLYHERLPAQKKVLIDLTFTCSFLLPLGFFWILLFPRSSSAFLRTKFRNRRKGGDGRTKMMFERVVCREESTKGNGDSMLRRIHSSAMRDHLV